jgi:hypothetical protein
VGGICGALQITTTSAVSSLTTDGSLGTVAHHLYWTGGNGVYTIAVDGTGLTTIATDSGGTTVNVMLHASNVYWGDTGRMYYAPITAVNGTGTLITTLSAYGVIMGGNLYWLDSGAYQIDVYNLSTNSLSSPWTFPTSTFDGGMPQLMNLATNGNELFFTTDSSTATIYQDQGFPPYSVFTGANFPRGCTADSTNFYWIDATSIARGAALPSSTTKLSYTVSTASIATDGAYLYAAQTTGAIVKMPIGSPTSVTTLATGQTGPANLALDSQNIYWSTSNGAILTMRR